MPNANTIAQAMTSAAAFCPSDGLGNATAEAAFSKSSNAMFVYLPGSSKLSNKPFRIKAWGRITGGTSGNFTASIYLGSTSTYSDGTKVATTGAVADAGVSGSFYLAMNDCIWDSTSGKLQGQLSGRVNAVIVSAAIDTSVTVPGSSYLPTTEGWMFTITGLFGSTNAGNTAILDGFEVEVM